MTLAAIESPGIGDGLYAVPTRPNSRYGLPRWMQRPPTGHAAGRKRPQLQEPRGAHPSCGGPAAIGPTRACLPPLLADALQQDGRGLVVAALLAGQLGLG